LNAWRSSFMDLHEYQAKELLKARGVACPEGAPAETPEEARRIAERLAAGWPGKLIIKAQIHAGGRGKGRFTHGFSGGVRLADTPEQIEAYAREMLGRTLVTAQTGPAGRLVRKVLVAIAPEVEREMSLSVLLDHAAARPMFVASAEGGVEIETLAKEAPEKIIREQVDPGIGLSPYQCRKVAKALGLGGGLLNEAARLIQGVYRTWSECDASLIEINPLAVIRNPDGTQAVAALDAKATLEDNALARHPELAALRDEGEASSLEAEASRCGLSYIKLNGNIACLVNGAGLAMATMDLIKHYGGDPANFLDVGGGASVEQVAAAFRIILQDPNVRAILVNIFGGIMECDVAAEGVVTALRETKTKLPLVVRLEGNRVEEGRRILAESGLRIASAESMDEAARWAVAAARGEN